MKVLVVDDSKGSRRLIVSRLENFGHQAVEAESAEEALRRLRSTKFDLLITDFDMPGMNGVELINLAIGGRRVRQAILNSLDPMETICKICTGLRVTTEHVTHYLSKHDRGADSLRRAIALIEAEVD